MEKTLVVIKPDALQRALIGEIVRRLEAKGLKIVGMKMILLSDELLDRHYSHVKDLAFFSELKSFMKSGPGIAICCEGIDAARTVRKLCGITKAREAEPGTIRGDLAMSTQCNVIHASEDRDQANREIRTFFLPEEIFEYEMHNLQGHSRLTAVGVELMRYRSVTRCSTAISAKDFIDFLTPWRGT